MKSITSGIMILLFAQLGLSQNNYDSLWKEVQQLEQKGLTESAKKKVEEISNLADSETNEQQQIKALIHLSKYAMVLEEDSHLRIIDRFKSQIADSKGAKQAILQNMLAALYWKYFQQNRYRFYERTETSAPVDEDDFRTWDLKTLFKTINREFKISLSNQDLLKSIPVKQYKVLLVEQDESELYRPSLYDLLAHEALEFYKSGERTVINPAYKFRVDDKKYLSESGEFMELKLQSKDSLSKELQALKLFQDLMSLHSGEKEGKAFVQINNERLFYVNEIANFDEKEEELIRTLKKEFEDIKSSKEASVYLLGLAETYKKLGDTYIPETKEEHRFKLKEAVGLCDSILKKYPDSRAASLASNLRGQILLKSHDVRSEHFIPSNQTNKLLVEYKNLDLLYFKIYRISESGYDEIEKLRSQEDKLEFIKSLTVYAEWEDELRDEGDHQSHSSEFVIPPLPSGIYLILVAPDKEVESSFSYKVLQATDLALVDKSDNRSIRFQIINRNNGRPIKNAEVELEYILPKQSRKARFITDNFGEISEKSTDDYHRLNARVKLGNEQAYFKNINVYHYWRNEDDKEQLDGFIFTDRSIYRPGQTLYYKSIVLKRNKIDHEVLEQKNIDIVLYDPNGQEVSRQSKKTNEYGSVQGEFILPSGGLNGDFRINIEIKEALYKTHWFSVEEYKRPKFKPEFEPITGEFRVNDQIRVKGKAVAYSGSNISDAKVRYTVKRLVQMPYWYYWFRPAFNSEPQEIAFGETTTGSDGSFSIDFKAIPDPSVKEENLPIFRYEVAADIIDINGETRSASSTVNVGYHSLNASVFVPSQLDKSTSTHSLVISTANLNGEKLDVKGHVKIYKLVAPGRILRPRPWPAPDYQQIDENDFVKMFPHEAYKNEANINNWQKGKQVYEYEYDGAEGDKVALNDISRWDSGYYLIEFETKDNFGKLVTAKARTQLYSDSDRRPSDNKLFHLHLNKDEYQAGEQVIASFSSNMRLWLTVEVEKNKRVVSKEILELNKNKKSIKIDVEREDIGGFVIHYSYSGFNSYGGGYERVEVPYPNTELKIETLSFRDKIDPGKEEEWEFKITGAEGERLQAEMLASMYDVSLDQFRPHDWQFNPVYRKYYSPVKRINASASFGQGSFRSFNYPIYFNPVAGLNFDRLNWFDFWFSDYYGFSYNSEPVLMARNMSIDEDSMEVEELVAMADSDFEGSTSKSETEDSAIEASDAPLVRKNLNETAFFYPQLFTDEDGQIRFKFKTPEALTTWKLQLLAHTKNLESVVASMETMTQKELMVTPNVPRFLREGDSITIISKIANVSEKYLQGRATLELIDPINGESLDTELENTDIYREFSVDQGRNTEVSWTICIPIGIESVQYKIIAKTEEYSDGEQGLLPVLTNRMLVTETLPVWVKSDETRSFSLDKLKNTSSATLVNHKLSVEITSNPAWYAVQALPYLMEFPHDCNEQIFSRLYANALATHIANSNPKIEAVFNQWRNTDALLSNLEKNQELKALIIRETPWLRDAQNETEQKKRIALLFDINKMRGEFIASQHKLANNQLASGAWPWFKGGREHRFITQHIISGFGHLKKLGVSIDKNRQMISKAITYLDFQFIKEYDDLKTINKKADLSKDHLSYSQLHYLYMRSFFPEVDRSERLKEIGDYYLDQIDKYWLSRTLYAKGMMALVSHRHGRSDTASKIMASLKETSITNDELGMYWKSNTASWYWYQAPIETQALMIEAFAELSWPTNDIDNLRVWLLKNKQTNNWKTTKATSDAIYALLLTGSDWLSVEDSVELVLGDQVVKPNKSPEAGSGYFKMVFSKNEITAEMGDIKMRKKGAGIAWSNIYWQYFKDLDKITSAETPLKLQKKLFLKSNTETGELLSEIDEQTPIQVGDLVRVRIELRVDRPMEFVHMKDMRASGFEPLNVLSTYKWQDGLGYYESTGDAATNFFFDYLPKGVFVFEYDLRANNSGDFSNGITSIQCMYAPEFSSHSKGIRVEIAR